MNKEIENIRTGTELLNRKYNKTGLLVVYPILILTLILLAFICIFKTEVVIKANGIIENYNIGQEIQSLADTEVVKINIKNGIEVKKGEVLIEFNSSEIESKIKDQNELLEEEKKKKEYIQNYKSSILYGPNYLSDDSYGFKSKYENYLLELEKIDISNTELTKKNEDLSESKIEKSVLLDKQIKDDKLMISYYEQLINVIKTGEYVVIDNPVVSLELENYKLSIEKYKIEEQQINENVDVIDGETALPIDEQKKLKQLEISNYKSTFLLQIEEKIQNLNKNITNYQENQLLLKENSNIDTSVIEVNKVSQEALTKQQLNEVESMIAEQEKEISNLSSQLINLENEKQNYSLIASQSGVIKLDEKILVGKIFPSGSSLGKIIDEKRDENYLKVIIPSNKILDIKKNQKLKFRLDDQSTKRGHSIEGLITNINAETYESEQGSYYFADAKIHSKDNLPVGMTGEVYIITERITYFNYLKTKYLIKK